MTIRFIDSNPNGIRICQIEGESLITVIVPRDLLAEAKKLPDIPKRGIYYLLDEDHGVISRVYAGQTTQGLARLDAHKSKKEFWNVAIMFLDDEVNIDRDVLDALEAKAIEYVRSHGSYETDNKGIPQPYINPYKEQTIQRLHEGILYRMNALGYDLDRKETALINNGGVFHTKKNGIAARGHYDLHSGKFTVLAGSQVDLRRPIIKNGGAAEIRTKLFGNEKIIAMLDDDVTFSTPSTAAVFVLGGSQNGWIEWINDKGETLDAVCRGNKDKGIIK